MKYTELKLYDFQKLDGSLNNFDSKGRRQSGLHVSGLVRSAYKNIFNLESQAIAGEQPNVRVMTGFLWERMLEHAFTEYMEEDAAYKRRAGLKQFSVEKDGVHGTPDGLYGAYVEEYKATWRSMRKWSEDPEAEFWMWMAQVKAYCYMTQRVKARFFIFWVNGDYSYKTGRGPQVTTCEMEFTPEELVDNWTMLLAHKDGAVKENHE